MFIAPPSPFVHALAAELGPDRLFALAEYERTAAERFDVSRRAAPKPAAPKPARQPGAVASASTAASDAVARVAAERQRAAEIARWCHAAGRDDLAPVFIRQGIPSAVALERLVGARRAEQFAASPEARYPAEYARNRAAYQRAGLSESDYVASRRADVEGLPFAR